MKLEILFVLRILLILVMSFFAMRKDRFKVGGFAGNALQELHSALNPSVKNTIIEQQKDHIKEDDSGEPPSKDKHLIVKNKKIFSDYYMYYDSNSLFTHSAKLKTYLV